MVFDAYKKHLQENYAVLFVNLYVYSQYYKNHTVGYRQDIFPISNLNTVVVQYSANSTFRSTVR